MAVLADRAATSSPRWSWFGTNQLGVGLHTYGFNNTLAMGLVVFWVTQFAVIGLGVYLSRRGRGAEVLLR